jgi:hypothetical protein
MRLIVLEGGNVFLSVMCFFLLQIQLGFLPYLFIYVLVTLLARWSCSLFQSSLKVSSLACFGLRMSVPRLWNSVIVSHYQCLLSE